MEFRKLISFGNSSFVVSLPKAWVEKNKLSKGDMIYIEEKNDELALFPSNNLDKEEPKDITIDVSNKTVDSINREIVSAYINNYGTMTFVGDGIKDKSPSIRNFLHKLVALEIMEQTFEKITAKSLLNFKDVPISDIIRRMDIITRAIIFEVQEVPAKTNYNHLYERDLDVNRLYFLAQRVLKSGMADPRISKLIGRAPIQLMSDWWLIMNLEKTADEAKRIAKLLTEFNLKPGDTKDLMDTYNSICKNYTDVMKAYYTRNKSLADAVADSGKVVIEKCSAMLKTHKKPGTANILEKLKNMQTHVRNIARNVIVFQ